MFVFLNWTSVTFHICELLSQYVLQVSVEDITLCHQASSTRRRCMKSSKTHSAADSGAAASGHSKADGPMERLSHISCECHQSAGRRRCTASPELEGQEGKENELRSGLDVDSCRVNGASDKQDPEDMDCEEINKNFFPDDDSNQILPVEQFFGNLDTVQVRHFGLCEHDCESIKYVLWVIF